jgi:hypothetical protein
MEGNNNFNLPQHHLYHQFKWRRTVCETNGSTKLRKRWGKKLSKDLVITSSSETAVLKFGACVTTDSSDDQ